jgi:anthranilate synthase component 1
VSELYLRKLAADFITPVRAYGVVYKQLGHRSSFLFESVVPGERWGRYSIIGCLPNAEGVYTGDDPLGSIGAEIKNLKKPDTFIEALVEAQFGWFSYDVANQLHKIEPAEGRHVLGRVMSGQTIILFDNLEQTLTIASKIENVVKRCEGELRKAAELVPMPVPSRGALPDDIQLGLSDEAFAERVARAKEYIAAGDAFQIVLARSFRTPIRDSDPFDVYRALRVLSPSPYLYFMHFSQHQMADALDIIGASPETMVRVEGNKITLRPIAGTRPRGKDEDEDRRFADELASDPKERAEHVMLVDLARNDIGRVATPGTVKITKQMEVERFSHVMHLVSEVTGEIAPDTSHGDVLKSTFPAGTLTGAPKVRAMQIIRELEVEARDHYGGAIGYFMPGGDFDIAIAIRTAVAYGGEYTVMAGAGVVEGSNPAAEAEESRNKAASCLSAIKAAQDLAAVRASEEAARKKKEEEAVAKEPDPKAD